MLVRADPSLLPPPNTITTMQKHTQHIQHTQRMQHQALVLKERCRALLETALGPEAAAAAGGAPGQLDGAASRLVLEGALEAAVPGTGRALGALPAALLRNAGAWGALRTVCGMLLRGPPPAEHPSPDRAEAEADAAAGALAMGLELLLAGRAADAEPPLRAAEDLARSGLGAGHLGARLALAALDACEAGQGRLGSRCKLEQLACMEDVTAAFMHGSWLKQVGQPGRAMVRLQPALAWLLARHGSQHRTAVAIAMMLGECMLLLGRYDDASRALCVALEGMWAVVAGRRCGG